MIVSDGWLSRELERRTYEFKPIHIPMCRHKLVDVPVGHPL